MSFEAILVNAGFTPANYSTYFDNFAPSVSPSVVSITIETTSKLQIDNKDGVLSVTITWLNGGLQYRGKVTGNSILETDNRPLVRESNIALPLPGVPTPPFPGTFKVKKGGKSQEKLETK